MKGKESSSDVHSLRLLVGEEVDPLRKSRGTSPGGREGSAGPAQLQGQRESSKRQ